MTDKERVLAVFPEAYERVWRGNVQIARPRTEQDRQSVMSFVALSSLHSDASIAWFYAARKLDG
jgi:hypothetical protein